MENYKSHIAVILPCYNEALSIASTIEDHKKKLPEADIYVIDNNSSDDTASIAQENGAIVIHEYKQGKGNAVKKAFRVIDADCYFMADGDDTYPADRAKEMCDLVLTRKSRYGCR